MILIHNDLSENNISSSNLQQSIGLIDINESLQIIEEGSHEEGTHSAE